MEMLTVTEDPTAALTTYRLMDRYAFNKELFPAVIEEPQ